ncbi:MAG TPA: sodium:solute symporter family protein [Pirellulaceae bacterium]|nr:sodium:solute symporter family protein [Pirellulaceae bacterium]
MLTLDVVVLVAYLLVMIAIGLMAMKRTKTQSDYFLGGRSFGKLLQTFAAFGAGTGAHEPVNVGRTVWTSGLSGVWSAMLWLFVTPIYWLTAVWYRRMRHLTLGDWFVERYESRGLGVAFTLYALAFYMTFLSTMLSAIAKFAIPLLGVETLFGWNITYVLVIGLGVTVVAYGVVGGLTAAYWTDLIQGTMIILLSVLLIPFGLMALVREYGNPQTEGWTDGFRILHERVSPEYFSVFHGPSSGEFPLVYIVAFSMLGLVGIVVHPHFIATGGGSAKSENEARIGLVAGNFLKRLCTVGWAIAALIALALLAGNAEIALDRDRAWGVAAREILGPLNIGLVGLMFACLMAAMMSSADTYMLVSSALVVRNVVAPFIAPHATEKQYVTWGRWTGVLLVAGASIVALSYSDVLEQFKLAMEIPLLLAAPFWLGLYWRRVNARAVWLTMGCSLMLFFVLPFAIPQWWPGLRTNPDWYGATPIVTTTATRAATAADVARLEAWNQAHQRVVALDDQRQRERLEKQLGPRPPEATIGQAIEVVTRRGGHSLYWQGGLEPTTPGPVSMRIVSRIDDTDSQAVVQVYDGPLQGKGYFNLEFAMCAWLPVDLSGLDKPTLESLRIVVRLALPFALLIVFSLVTPRQSQAALDRYYVKMKTPVERDPEADQKALQESYANPHRWDHLKWFAGSDWEFCRPRASDVVGFLVSVMICCLILGLLVWLAGVGA